MQNNMKKIIDAFPIIKNMQKEQPVLWCNEAVNEKDMFPFSMRDVSEAKARFERFAPYFKVAFPEMLKMGGKIQSPLNEIPHMQARLGTYFNEEIRGNLLLKCDDMLPIAGSVKARGGIHEILKHAEQLAWQHGLLTIEDDYSKLYSEQMRQFFSQYKIAVGSTGNLGLSIGLMSAKLGFHVTVHMSHDAKEWKKDMLRQVGATVVEYEADYSEAVKKGRQLAEGDHMCHFVDDENSLDLFTGYAVAAEELAEQLKEKNIAVDATHPLFVYIPCGVGGAPGGISYGLKQRFGEHIHIFFAEPVASPCMLLGMMTGLQDAIDVGDIGLSNKTVADGLAVGRASKFVGSHMRTIVSGCFTVEDSFLYNSLVMMLENEARFLEPSAHAGFYGMKMLLTEGNEYLQKHCLEGHMNNASHVVWSTGGRLVPEAWREQYVRRAREERI